MCVDRSSTTEIPISNTSKSVPSYYFFSIIVLDINNPILSIATVSDILSASIRVAQVIKWTLSPDIVSTGIDWVRDRNRVLPRSSYLLSRLTK